MFHLEKKYFKTDIKTSMNILCYFLKKTNLHEFQVNEYHITHLFLAHEITIPINLIQLSAMYALYARN